MSTKVYFHCRDEVARRVMEEGFDSMKDTDYFRGHPVVRFDRFPQEGSSGWSNIEVELPITFPKAKGELDGVQMPFDMLADLPRRLCEKCEPGN